jgi:hypothetical protein
LIDSRAETLKLYIEEPEIFLDYFSGKFIQASDFDEFGPISDCFEHFANQNFSQEKIEELINRVNETCPSNKAFFSNWFEARVELSKFSDGIEEALEKANNYYSEAFEYGKELAGAFIRPFLNEAIATSVFSKRKDSRRVTKTMRMEDREGTTPINKKAKQFYDYGFALNIFEELSSDTYFLHFNAERNFVNIFGREPYFNDTSIDKILSEQKLISISTIEYSKLQDINGQKVFAHKGLSEKNYQRLKKVTVNNINKLMAFPDRKLKYTPLSFACEYELLDIAEMYLENFKGYIDVNILNEAGSTALILILRNYKSQRFAKNKQETEKLKKITLKIIFLSSQSGLLAQSHGIVETSAYMEAIDCFDLEILKLILEKIDYNSLPNYLTALKMEAEGQYEKIQLAMKIKRELNEFEIARISTEIGSESVWPEEMESLKSMINFLKTKIVEIP